MIRTMGGRIATRAQLERFSLSVADLGPGPYAVREKRAGKKAAPPALVALPVTLCRLCDHPVSRDYSPYCSRACAKAGV